MTRPAFVRQWTGATGEGVISATNEAGVVAGDPVAGGNNTGHMPLRASGIPLTTGSYDLALQRGGNATGYYTIDTGDTTVPGATLRYRLEGETSTQWRGYNDTAYLTYATPVDMATAVEDYPGISSVVALSGGGYGYCRVMRHSVSADAVQFVYRATRRGDRTVVNIVTDGTLAFDTDHGPGLCRLASGRLLCAIQTVVGSIIIYASDDDGLTWSLWSLDAGLSAGTVERQINMEVVEDAVVLVASMVPAGTTLTAIVAWSYDGGQTFNRIASPTWGPTRTCVTATGVVLATATDQSTTSAGIYRLFPGAGVGAAIANLPGGAHATASVLAIVRRDDGVLLGIGSSTTTLACSLLMGVSLDHGVTWFDPTGQSSSATVWTNGINTATPRGFSQVGAGMFGDVLIVVGVTDGTTAAQDDSNYELQFGGWDSLTEGREALGVTEPYSSGTYLALDIPTAVDWVATDAGTGASLTIDDEGLTISGDATDNSYYTSPSTFFAAATYINGWRWRIVFKATSGGSVGNNSACIAVESDDGGGDIAGAYLRINVSQIRLVDHAGNTLGESDLVVNQFDDDTEVLVALDATYSASEGIVSAWFRRNAGTHWTSIADGVTITKTTAAVTRPRIGAIDTAAAVWTLKQFSISPAELGLAAGFTNPTDLDGRPLSAARDFYLENGISVGAAGGGGVGGDTYDLVTDAAYAAAWVWRTLRPSAEHRSTADNASHALVFSAGANNVIAAQFVGLMGTNFRTATFQMHTADSWGTPSVSVGLDATLYQGTISASKRGLGYVGVDGAPWVPHQWRSIPGRRFYAAVGSAVYEIGDSDGDAIYLQGGDFSAASGAIYIFGDRMGAVLSGGVQRYRYARALVGAQQTSADYYKIGTVIAGLTTELTDPYANGFVWTYPDNTTEAEAEGGFVVTRAAGPIRSEIRMAWDPVSAPESRQLQALESLWRAVRGRAEPVLFGPDLLNRPNQFGLYHMVGPYAEEQLTGELDNRLARVAQIILREVI